MDMKRRRTSSGGDEMFDYISAAIDEEFELYREEWERKREEARRREEWERLHGEEARRDYENFGGAYLDCLRGWS